MYILYKSFFGGFGDKWTKIWNCEKEPDTIIVFEKVGLFSIS